MTNRVNATESYDLNHSQTESALASQRDVTVSEEEVRSSFSRVLRGCWLGLLPKSREILDEHRTGLYFDRVLVFATQAAE